jgi:hypothetical protein
MVAICILVLSVAALIEFAVSQWRSVWINVAAQPLSDRWHSATGVSADAITANDFSLLLRSNVELSPSVPLGNRWLKEVNIYYHIVRAIEGVAARSLPGLASWAKNELVSCSRFAASVLDRRLNENLIFSAEFAGNFPQGLSGGRKHQPAS